MATFEKREGKKRTTWRVRVRRSDGPWLTRSFPTRKDGEAWACRLSDTAWQEIYGYFMHEPTAPAYAATLMRAWADRQ